MDEVTEKRIHDLTIDLYKLAMDLTVKPSDPEYTKLMNTETLPMLNDIELVLYGYIERYGAYGEFSSDLLDADAIKIRK